MKKVLLITDVNFWERSSGNRVRIYNLIEYLTKYCKLTVVNTGPAPAGIERHLAIYMDAEFIVLEKNNYLSSIEYGRKFKAIVKNRNFEVAIIQYIHNSYFLDHLDSKPLMILDVHDLIYERAEEFRRFNYEGTLFEMAKETEEEIFKAYDYVIAICKPDYETITGIVGERKTLLCPHPVLPRKPIIRKNVHNIVFIGSSYIPNRDAINFFLANSWPFFAKKHDVNLSIYGTVNKWVYADKIARVYLKGFESDIEKIYAEADIIINPVRFGSGIKIKNIEALANGIPLVTTTHGARGLEAMVGKGILVADEPNDQINALDRLIEDGKLREKMSEYGYSFICENFSADVCFKNLLLAIGMQP